MHSRLGRRRALLKRANHVISLITNSRHHDPISDCLPSPTEIKLENEHQIPKKTPESEKISLSDQKPHVNGNKKEEKQSHTELDNKNDKVNNTDGGLNQKSKKIHKFHMTMEEIQIKVQKIEDEVKALQGTENANKRKRLYQKLAKLKKALEAPEEFTVDPNPEKERIQKDKERRIQKKLERAKKQKEEESKEKHKNRRLICALCKKRGHVAADCKKVLDETVKPNPDASICYNCGSNTHSLKDCRRERQGDSLRFATCFFCKQSGHISRDCPQNERGIYFKGGSCFKCGSTRHLAKECPKIEEEQAPKN